MTLSLRTPKRVVVGSPLRSSQLPETLLPKRLAMPVFCSDPLSSVAYATEEVLLVLSLGGLASLHLAWYVAVVIAVLLVVVVASYRQTCRAYPNGGGAYTVASVNLGRSAGLAAASALLVDYVLTVAVSVVGRRRGHHLRAAGPGRARGRAVRGFRGAADRDEPAGDQGVRRRLRRADLRLPARRLRGVRRGRCPVDLG
jgi:hypothetical protein